MSFDGFVTAAVVAELKNTLIGVRIDKIYQPEKEDLLLHLHDSNGKYKLFLSANGGNARVHLTTNDYSNPENPSAFCMLLRKHLQGGRIVDIIQPGSERIVQLIIEHTNEMGYPTRKSLISEIMGKHSNLIVVDIESNRIIDSIKRVSPDISRVRQLLPGLAYQMPPDQGKTSFFEVTKERVAELIAADPKNPSRALQSGIAGLSPTLCDLLLFASQDELSNEATEQETSAALFLRLQESIAALETGTSAYVYSDENGVPADFHVLPLLEHRCYLKESVFTSISACADYYFTNRASANRVKQKSSDLTKTLQTAIDKLLLKKQRLSEDLLKAENADRFRLFGELLTTVLHTIPPGAETVQVSNYYEEGALLTIPLDPRMSGAKNAQRYYKKYGKAKTAIKEIQLQLQEVNESVDYLESVLTYSEQASTVEETMLLRNELIESGFLRKKKDKYQPSAKIKPKPLRFQTSDGFTLLVGRNNQENDRLTFQSAEKKDLWLHTKDIPGSHVILVTNGNPVTESALFEAASLAAYYSKGRNSANVPVDYVPIRHVKKPSGAKPGKVIFTENRTLYVTPALCKPL